MREALWVDPFAQSLGVASFWRGGFVPCGKSCTWPSGGMTHSASEENTLQRKEILVKHHIQLVPKKKGRKDLRTTIQLVGNRCGNSGNSVRLYFSGLQNTAVSDCSHEIKRRLLLGRKVMTNIDRMLKSRGITLPTKVCLVKAMVFPVIMCGCESWTINKAEYQLIDAF